MASSFGDKLKAFGQKITGQAPPPEPESLPQTLLRQVDEATTLTWKQVCRRALLLGAEGAP
jgi:hypothetical protein